MAPDPEVTEVPVPDPADPVAWVFALSVDELPGVPVAVAGAEWVGDTEWLGDADPVDVTVGLAELLSVVLGVDVGLGQPPDGDTVTVALCVGLGFGEVLVGVGVGVGVGVVLPLSLGLGEALVVSLTLGPLLALVMLAGLVVVLAGLPDRTAGLVFAAAFDGLDEAAGDDEHVGAALGVPSSPDAPTCDAPLLS